MGTEKKVATVLELWIARVHPDPEQPRVDADAELKDSIVVSGVKQPITVRPHPEKKGEWMIVDGERRYRGSIAAKRRTIPAIVDDSKSVADPGKRLIEQLRFNTGKPLSPAELGRAYVKAMELTGLSASELADALGVSRSTIGDRARLAQIDPVWLDAIAAGKGIQASHATILFKYRAVPSKYQAEALALILADYRATRHIKQGDPIPVDDFEGLAREHFRRFLRALDEFPKGAAEYTGPVASIKDYAGQKEPTRYAADPDSWRPIVRSAQALLARQKKEASKAEDGSLKAVSGRPWSKLPPGAGVRTAKYYGSEACKAEKGERQIIDRDGHWIFGDRNEARPFDPAVFLANVDPSKLFRITSQYDGVTIGTSDASALAVATTAWVERWDARRKKLELARRAQLRPLVDKDEHRVGGPGAIEILLQLAGDRSRGSGAVPEFMELARILGLEGAEGVRPGHANHWDQRYSRPFVAYLRKLAADDVGLLLTSYVASIRAKFDTVADQLEKEQRQVLGQFRAHPVKWPAPDGPVRVDDEAVQEIKAAQERDEQRAAVATPAKKAKRAKAGAGGGLDVVPLADVAQPDQAGAMASERAATMTVDAAAASFEQGQLTEATS